MPSQGTRVFSGAARLWKKGCQVPCAWVWLDFSVLTVHGGGVGVKLAQGVSSLPCLTSSARSALQHTVIKLPFSLLGASWVINWLASEKAIGSHGQSGWVPGKSQPAAELNGPFPSLVLFLWIKSLRGDWTTGMTIHGYVAWLFNNGPATLLSYQPRMVAFSQKCVGQTCRKGLRAGPRLCWVVFKQWL